MEQNVIMRGNEKTPSLLHLEFFVVFCSCCIVVLLNRDFCAPLHVSLGRRYKPDIIIGPGMASQLLVMS